MIDNTIPIYDKNLPLADVLASVFGSRITVQESRSLTGGCIGDVRALFLSNKEIIVHKKYSVDSRKEHSPEYRCMIEAIGLQRIADTNSIAVPTLYAIHGNAMLLSYHKSERPQSERAFWIKFAHLLANLHQTNLHQAPLQPTQTSQTNIPHEPLYGFTASQYDAEINNNPLYTHEPIEPPHKNYTSWVKFYTEERIWKQCKRAEYNGYFNARIMKQADAFCTRLPSLIQEPEKPSLIHGDLWGGNYLCIQNTPMLIDPAVHIAHYEAEIALTELFNGYPQIFRDAYSEILPLDTSYYRERVDLYNLYHILNHLNLFGRSYYHQAVNIIERF